MRVGQSRAIAPDVRRRTSGTAGVTRLAAGLAHLAVGVAAAVILGACGGAASLAPTTSTPLAPGSASPAASLPASPVEGVIIAVDGSSLSDVRGFTLLTRAGQRIAFTLGTLENPTEFPPGHLAEHQATSSPVLVYFRVEAGVPVVYRLADASPAGPSAS